MLKNWMKRRTKNLLKKEMPVYEEELGVKINGFKVKNMQKWGSCNKNGKLTFNSQLAALPKELMDCVYQ